MGDIVGGLFGGSKASASSIPLAKFKATDFTGGGLRSQTTLGSGRVTVGSATEGRKGLVRSLREIFGQGANQTKSLRSQVTPGIGRLTEARVGAIEDARRRSIGNLRENLQRRRVLGSSFGQDALARAEAEFGREEAAARAQSFLEELDLSSRLLERETELRVNQFQTSLNELNLQTDLAAKLSMNATNAIASTSQMAGQLQNAGRESNIGITKDVAGAVGGFIFG